MNEIEGRQPLLFPAHWLDILAIPKPYPGAIEHELTCLRLGDIALDTTYRVSVSESQTRFEGPGQSGKMPIDVSFLVSISTIPVLVKKLTHKKYP
jgi:hypothetical protein